MRLAVSVAAFGAPIISERKFRRQLHDARVERAGDLAKSRRAESQPEPGRARLQAWRSNAGTHAVGQVECFAANFERSPFTNPEFSGKGGIEPPGSRTRNGIAAERTERAR